MFDILNLFFDFKFWKKRLKFKFNNKISFDKGFLKLFNFIKKQKEDYWLSSHSYYASKKVNFIKNF
jgi:hypothetical protein